MTLNERMDAAVDKVNRHLACADCDWEICSFHKINLHVAVWTNPTGDVENKLTDLLRRAADEMEVSRP